MLQDLIKLANKLDDGGHYAEASRIDALVMKLANAAGFTFKDKSFKTYDELVSALSDMSFKNELIAALKQHPALQNDSFMQFLAGGSLAVPSTEIAKFLVEKGLLTEAKSESLFDKVKGLGNFKLPTLQEALLQAGYVQNPQFAGGYGSKS